MLLKKGNMKKICSFYLMRNKGIIITIVRKIESYTYIDLEIIQIKDNIYSTELKPRGIVTFLCFTWKITHKWALKILVTRFTFIVERSKKKLVFSPKNGLTTCYLWRHISQPQQLTITELVSKCAERYWKRHLLMFYPRGKKLKKIWGDPPPPLPLVLTGVNGPVKLFWFKCNIEDSIVLHLTW